MKTIRIDRKIKSGLLFLFFTFCLGLFLILFSTESKAITYVGTCGKEVEWYLDAKMGILKFEGEGKIDNYDNYADTPWYEYRDKVRSVSISNGITNVIPGMFYRFEEMTDIEIPRTVVEVGDYAFYGCSKLREVSFAKNSQLAVIGESSFAYCRNLYKIEIPTRLSEIKKNAFMYCYKLPNITLGYSVKSVGEGAFSSCSFLKKIKIIDYKCDIYDDGDTIYNLVKIESFGSSTAKDFADKYLREFSKIKNISFLNDLKIKLEKTAYTYNGKLKQPKVSIKGLKENADYTVDYINNLKPGLATVMVSAAGNRTLGEANIDFVIKPSKVKKLRVETRKQTTLTLTWNKTYGADGYKVYQYVGNRWKRVGMVKSNSLTIKKLQPAQVYKFKVKAYVKTNDGKIYSEYSDILTTATKPQTPNITSVTNRGLKRLNVRWSSVSNCDGYDVYISTKSDKNYKLAGGTKSRYRCSLLILNLKSNQKYYIKVKAYKTVEGIKVYSADSEVESMSPM